MTNLSDHFQRLTGERSNRAIATRIDVDPSTLNRQLNGATAITVETVVAMCREYHLDFADAFIAAARATYGLTIEGLMCIPPADEPPGPHFALLRKIAERNGLAKLSMGMSGDFETAIRFGATSVRVGSAVFGARS